VTGRDGGPPGRHDTTPEALREALGWAVHETILSYAATARLTRYNATATQIGYTITPTADGHGTPIDLLTDPTGAHLTIGTAGHLHIPATTTDALLTEITHWITGVLTHRVTETLWHHRGRIVAATVVIDPDWSRVTIGYTRGILGRSRADRTTERDYPPYPRSL
jgi:hypothetical protein